MSAWNLFVVACAACGSLLTITLVIGAIQDVRRHSRMLRRQRPQVISDQDRRDILVFHAIKHTTEGPIHVATNVHVRPVRASQMRQGDGR